MSPHICHSSPATPLPLFNIPAIPQQAGNGEFVCGFESPPIPNVFHCSLFQLNCYSIHCAACFPAVVMASKGPPLPFHARKSCGEGNDGDFSFLLCFPPIPNFFLHLLFAIELLSCLLCLLPSLGQYIGSLLSVINLGTNKLISLLQCSVIN